MIATAPLALFADFAWPTWVDQIPLPVPYNRWAVVSALAILLLVVLSRFLRLAGRILRRRRPVTIHPNLQKYSVDNAELDRKRRELAVRIVATSTGNRLAGFRIVRQVEAVFVEGLRTPEEAIVAMKAAAVERGANALLNVQTQRTTAGKCTASGDAILVAPLTAKMPTRTPVEPAAPPPVPPPLPPPQARE